VGGAAINRRFGRRILFTEDGSPYEPGVFYCKDAFEGLETIGQLVDPVRRPALVELIRREADMEIGYSAQPRETQNTGQRSNIIARPFQLPANLTCGAKVVRSMPLELIFQHLNINELYRLSWGAKNTHGAEWDKLKLEFDLRLERMKHAAMKEGWLKPQAVYGIFPCQSDGNELIIYYRIPRGEGSGVRGFALPKGQGAEDAPSMGEAPSMGVRELTRFSFPRQPHDDHLCLADYFARCDSGWMDVVAFQVVTVGQAATVKIDALQAAGDYSEAYFLHGLAVQTAEATAEYLHQHIRRELGIPERQGKRYSWGYPAVPELEDHRKVFYLLPAEKELGMSLTSAFQLLPEQSTAAIIVPHPQARYYTTGESRVEQLMK
jgi:5-methyltetrahydrofolate--homocysteine methyltransferase